MNYIECFKSCINTRTILPIGIYAIWVTRVASYQAGQLMISSGICAFIGALTMWSFVKYLYLKYRNTKKAA
ncbi:MAG: hypothetical protein M1114_05590 [Candidatus Dependentiae bacterium]|nr:hypothetical protein [Candidatus Dependentiae bacterium]